MNHFVLAPGFTDHVYQLYAAPHANLAAAGHALQLVLGFQTVIFSCVQTLVLQTKVHCFLHIQKEDGLETKCRLFPRATDGGNKDDAAHH